MPKHQLRELLVLAVIVEKFFRPGHGDRSDLDSLLTSQRQPNDNTILSKVAEQAKAPAVSADQTVLSKSANLIHSVETNRTKMAVFSNSELPAFLRMNNVRGLPHR